jgi:hypothetical protein
MQYRSLTFKGETLPLPEWAERLGCAPQVLDARLKKLGWSVERALTTPIGCGWRTKAEVAFERLVLDIDHALRVYAATTAKVKKRKARGDKRGGGIDRLSAKAS